MLYNVRNKYFQQPTTSLTEDIVALIARKTGCKPKLRGSNYILLCPAHNDRKPSLSVKEGFDGRVLFHCFCQCSAEEICHAVDIELRDLFPHNKRR